VVFPCRRAVGVPTNLAMSVVVTMIPLAVCRVMMLADKGMVMTLETTIRCVDMPVACRLDEPSQSDRQADGR